MIVYFILLLTFLIALAALQQLRKPRHWSRWALGCALALFIHLYGSWVYVSFYLKYAFDAAFLFLLIWAIAGSKHAASAMLPVYRVTGNAALAALFALLSVTYFTGLKPAPAAASIHFPFKSGSYFVLQGGNGYPSNFFHAASSHGLYAIDLVKLSTAGQRSRRIFSKKLEDYYIFADTIYSPVAGVIRRAVDDNPDNIPPDRTRGQHNLNNVLIESKDYYVFLGHLKQYRVFVKEGAIVQPGTPLGLAGNSGYSLEPHLHIQVHRKNSALPWYRQPPIPVSFNGRQYGLFEQFNVVQHQ